MDFTWTTDTALNMYIVFCFISLPQNEWRRFTSTWWYNAALPAFQHDKHCLSVDHWSSLVDICQSLEVNVLIWLISSTEKLILKTENHWIKCHLSHMCAFFKNCWLKSQWKGICVKCVCILVYRVRVHLYSQESASWIRKRNNVSIFYEFLFALTARGQWKIILANK